jgi:hypothetical protein
MSTQTNFQYLIYLFWINFCLNHVPEILSIPPLWKWWMVAMLKLCKNLVHIFVLYAFLNLLVYFETRAWNKTLWEANAYDQILVVDLYDMVRQCWSALSQSMVKSRMFSF